MEHIAALRHIQTVGLRRRFRALSTTPVNAETPPALEIAGQNTAAPAHAAELAQGFRELFAMEPVCPWDAAAASALVSYCAAPPLGRMSECAGERDPLARHPPCLPYAGGARAVREMRPVGPAAHQQCARWSPLAGAGFILPRNQVVERQQLRGRLARVRVWFARKSCHPRGALPAFPALRFGSCATGRGDQSP